MASLPRPFSDKTLPRPFCNSESSFVSINPISAVHYPPWYSGGSGYCSQVNHQLSVNRAVPLGIKAPWSSPEVLEALHHKEDLLDHAKRYNTPQAWSQVKGQQRLLGDLVGNANKQYHNNNRFQRSIGPKSLYCDTCDRGFGTQDELESHLSTHTTCSIGGCTFRAHPKVVSLHRKMQHITGLAQKIIGLNSPEDIEKWRNERKRNFPTATNIERKRKEQEERVARGEVLENKYFGKMRRGGHQQQRNGNQNGKLEQKNLNGDSFRGRGRGRGRFRNRRGQYNQQAPNSSEMVEASIQNTTHKVKQQIQQQNYLQQNTGAQQPELIKTHRLPNQILSREMEYDGDNNGGLKRFRGTLHCYDNDEKTEEVETSEVDIVVRVPTLENSPDDSSSISRGQRRKRNRNRHNLGPPGGPLSRGVIIADSLEATTLVGEISSTNVINQTKDVNEINLSSDDSDVTCIADSYRRDAVTVDSTIIKPGVITLLAGCNSDPKLVIGLADRSTKHVQEIKLSSKDSDITECISVPGKSNFFTLSSTRAKLISVTVDKDCAGNPAIDDVEVVNLSDDNNDCSIVASIVDSSSNTTHSAIGPKHSPSELSSKTIKLNITASSSSYSNSVTNSCMKVTDVETTSPSMMANSAIVITPSIEHSAKDKLESTVNAAKVGLSSENSKEVAIVEPGAKKLRLEQLEEGELEDSDEETSKKELPTTGSLRFFLANADDSDEDMTAKVQPLSSNIPKASLPQAAAVGGSLSLLAGYGSDSDSSAEDRGNSMSPDKLPVKSSVLLRPIPDLYPTKAIEQKKRKRLSLLEKLLASEIRHERNVILQCVHHTVNRNFFQ